MIAILGWGSLIWDTKHLPIHQEWQQDGPLVRVEYLRQSTDGRLTLVLSQEVSPVRSLWTTFLDDNLVKASRSLCEREGIPISNIDHGIATWSQGQAGPKTIIELEDWTKNHNIESVVWTALPPKYNNVVGQSPNIDQACDYLCSLTDKASILAEQYVRRTPRQVDTLYRRRIEAVLGWLPEHDVRSANTYHLRNEIAKE